MSNADQRIAQWEQMAREAPDDMAYFSLGNAYRDAERHEDAAAAFGKAIEMNPDMSRAYQLQAQTLIKLGREDDAATLLARGYEVAAKRGDVMPQRAMASLLQKLGKPLPEVADAAPSSPHEAIDETQAILDRRTGTPQRRLDGPPMRGPVGQFIAAHFGQATWNDWIRQGTKVINELRLDFSNPQHQDMYDQYMLEWLQVSREEIDEFAKQGAA